jgi:hypothetical protein
MFFWMRSWKYQGESNEVLGDGYLDDWLYGYIDYIRLIIDD